MSLIGKCLHSTRFSFGHGTMLQCWVKAGWILDGCVCCPCQWHCQGQRPAASRPKAPTVSDQWPWAWPPESYLILQTDSKIHSICCLVCDDFMFSVPEIDLILLRIMALTLYVLLTFQIEDDYFKGWRRLLQYPRVRLFSLLELGAPWYSQWLFSYQFNRDLAVTANGLLVAKEKFAHVGCCRPDCELFARF